MSRTIKFRALKNGTWHEIDLSEGQRWSRQLLEYLKDGEATFEFETPLREFTGLKDKNGKEIYEGDIVKSWYDKTINWEVYWDKERFWLRNIPHSRELGDMNACDDAEWTIRANELEVIGNIYENKELLKEGGLKNGNSSNSS